MASIPLIALAGRPPEPVDTLGQYSRIMALKQAQQQMQYQQQMQPMQLQQEQQSLQIQHQQLVDQQAFHDAYSTWDGKNYDDLAGAVGKNGGSFQVVNGIRMAGLNQQKELSEILKNQGEAGKAHVQTLIDNNTIANQKISSLTGDDPQAVAAMAQEGFNAGWLDQQHAQALLKISQLPSDQMKATLPQFAKPFLSNAAQAEQVLKQAQTAEAQTKTAETQMMMQMGGTPQMRDARYANLKTQQAQGQTISPDDQAWLKGYEAQKLLVPKTVADIRLQGMGNLREYMVVDPNTGQARYASPSEINSANAAGQPLGAAQYSPTVQGNLAVSKEAVKNVPVIQTALHHLDALDQAADALNSNDVKLLNSIAQKYQTQVGSTPLATYRGLQQVVKGDIMAASSAVGAKNEAEEKAVNDITSPDIPVKALHASIGSVRSLMQQRLAAKQASFNAAAGGGNVFTPQTGGMPGGATHTYNPATGKIEAITKP